MISGIWHLGYDICRLVQIYRRFEGSQSSLSRSSTQRRRSLLLFLFFLYSTMKATESFEMSVHINQSKRINIPENVKTWDFRVRNGCTTWHWETSGRLSQCWALHSTVVIVCIVVLKHAIPYAVFRYTRVTWSCTSAPYAFHGEMPSWGSVPSAWYRVRFWKSWYWQAAVQTANIQLHECN
jgi:hypothetical protein